MEMVLIPEVTLPLFQIYLCFQTAAQLSLASQDRFYLVFSGSPKECLLKMFISIPNKVFQHKKVNMSTHMSELCYLQYSCSNSEFFYITVVFFPNFLQLFQILLLKNSRVEYLCNKPKIGRLNAFIYVHIR